LYNEGISKEGELIDIGVDEGFVQKSGAWYSYGENRIGQGKDNSREWLKENKDEADELEAKIREVKGIIPGEGEAAEAGDAPQEEEAASV